MDSISENVEPGSLAASVLNQVQSESLAKKEDKQSAWAKEFGIDDVEKYFGPEPVEPPRERTKKANLNATM